MRMEWDVPIEMDDGLVLRADVFRPPDDGRYPVIMSQGPYGKGLAFQEGYARQWEALARDHPEALAGSTNRYQAWELADPERWVPDGYAVVRVDSRGSGSSPGVIDSRSPREIRDFARCIEWAAERPWSNGRIGLLGISYYAINQWLVAGLQPPDLAAMIPWEGAADSYRDMSYHGGILCEFGGNWFRRQVMTVQHGMGDRAPRNPSTGEPVAGAVTLSDEELARNRVHRGQATMEHPLADDWHRARSADWSRVAVPFLSAANWGGQGLHARGNFEAFTQAASEQKWLEVHGLEHWTHFSTPYGHGLQKRFFGHFLKGEDTGWDREPRVRLQVRHADGTFVERHEHEWPLARTRWTAYHLDPDGMGLSIVPTPVEGRVTYDAPGDGVTFDITISEETEITGPIAARFFVSSSSTDADLFVVLRVLDPGGKEVTFQGANAPDAPVAQGWLRASHRRLDPVRSLPHRPYHTHDVVEPLVTGEIVQLDVEIWPTCIVVPAGWRLALSVRGRDCDYEGDVHRSCGPFTHGDLRDRPEAVFGGRVTLHAGGRYDSHVLLPVIPG